jgi:hypothetical protein
LVVQGFAFLVFAGLYLLLAGQVSLHEGAAAVVTGGAAALVWRRVRDVSAHRFTPSRAAAEATLRAVASLPRGYARVAVRLVAALARPEGGAMIAQPFLRGRRESGQDAIRRAVSVLGLSIAPDTIAVRLRPGRDELDIHALVGGADRDDPLWPV